MPGIKRPVESGDDRNGKRTKVKSAGGDDTEKLKKKDKQLSSENGGIVKKARSTNKDKKVSEERKTVKPLNKKRQRGKDSDAIIQEEDFDMDTDISEDSDIDMEDLYDADDMSVEESGKEDSDAIEEESADESIEESDSESDGEKSDGTTDGKKHSAKSNGVAKKEKKLSSREIHAKQKAITQERKAAKPNADLIARAKQIWERLRRKTNVPREERKQLVEELYGIITGRISDFVFKHDAVRTIQTALKYATVEQRKQIARELQGKYRNLAESRYAKFLLGKMLVHGDEEIRDMIIPEFYGHVRRLMRHPEASWILDDIYRTVATKEQRANILREWYGPEFSIFKDQNSGASAELSDILKQHPEKRGPIMRHLLETINQLVQKKTTGFTMLHDAMLQYFLNTKPGSTEASEFIELIKGDEEGDLAKNMAFTKSGARLMCLCLAYSTAKDRKVLLRFYRDTIKMMAADTHGHMILVTAFEVIDDTKLTAKSVFPELLNQDAEKGARYDELLSQVTDLTARIPVLYLFAHKAKWLLPSSDQEILKEVLEIRPQTSKKEPSIRRQELIRAASPTLLEFIAARAEVLMQSSFGCQFMTEVLFDADGDKTAALTAVAEAAKSKTEVKDSPYVGRMLKALVQGGRYNQQEKKIDKVDPPLGFDALFYDQIKDDVMSWAAGSQSFVIVALVESGDFAEKSQLLKTLKKKRKTLEKVAAADQKSSGEGRKKADPASSGAKILLEKL